MSVCVCVCVGVRFGEEQKVKDPGQLAAAVVTRGQRQCAVTVITITCLRCHKEKPKSKFLHQLAAAAAASITLLGAKDKVPSSSSKKSKTKVNWLPLSLLGAKYKSPVIVIDKRV